jgi:hypothetical protein
MPYANNSQCCHNCEYLRIDNYCLIKDKFILSKNVYKIHDCPNFSKKFVREILYTREHRKKIKQEAMHVFTVEQKE